ncbi:MAG TPA: sugar phosphate isomerase/epimerase family protein [Candidatus Paceibacterota bacterium]|nr:sugar phosphate isomerase/epimerase family protein [Verrucomicrobiota bacterium]HRY48712.1 sugar phosphate isomerase/epimerase family protein [Candidatus Paceibacterota bacterium]HSA01932.1 sugar phosphate isomerase/epimerase family protein [Candidatus Paceibacterota bacterium]
MKSHLLTRRQVLRKTGLVLGAASLGLAAGDSRAASTPQPESSSGGFTYCFNTGTILGQKLGLLKEIELAAQAGYDAIEPWVDSIEKYRQSGGALADVPKRLKDMRLTVAGAIGFAEWIVDDDDQRAKGLERAKHDMDLVAQIGGRRIAAPPAGATNISGLDLKKAADRYRALLELGEQSGVMPMLEIWGFSRNVSRLSEALFIAAETGHPQASVLADVFHLYKGGSDYRGLGLVHGKALPVFHLNDYPADPPRDKVNDSFRLMPGDGIAPLTQILRLLKAAGGRPVISLELFSRKYWEMDALAVAKEGLEKMKAAVARALAPD